MIKTYNLCIKNVFGAPDALSFEHFLPWVWKLVLIYQDEGSTSDDLMLPQGASFSKSKRRYKNVK